MRVQLLQFLFGKNLKDSNVEIKPGKMYLDLETKELYYDDPSGEDTVNHNKIIDTATLIYSITDTVTITIPSTGDGSGDPGDTGGGSGDNNSSSITAKLGVAVLGTMKLGSE